MTVILNFCVLSLVGYYPTLQKYTTWISYTLSNLWYFDNIFTIFQVSISQSIHQYGTFSASCKRKFVINWWFHQSFIDMANFQLVNTKQPFSKIKLIHIDKKAYLLHSYEYSYLSLNFKESFVDLNFSTLAFYLLNLLFVNND